MRVATSPQEYGIGSRINLFYGTTALTLAGPFRLAFYQCYTLRLYCVVGRMVAYEERR